MLFPLKWLVILIIVSHHIRLVNKQNNISTRFFFNCANCMFIFLSFPFLPSKNCIAQKTDTVSSDHYLEVELGGGYYLNSNAITTEFTSFFYKGGFITPEVKDRVQDKLKYSNRIGGDLDYGISIAWKPDSLWHKNNLSLNFSLKDRFHYDAGFSRDFFNVVMYGNKSYAGQTADLGNFTLNFLRYQQLRAGLEWEGDTARGSYGISLSVLKGENNFIIDADRAFLTTSSDGTKIDFDLAMSMRQTDTAQLGPGAFNGIGTSTDFFYEMPYLTWYNEGLLRLEVNDFGFIRWNTNSVYYHMDSIYHYDGIEINNLLDLQNNALPNGNPDSLLKNNVKYGTEPYTTLIPAVFTVTATTYYGKKFIFEKGMRFRMSSNCKPYYYAAFSCYFTKQFLATVTTSYGGYGNLNAGIELEYMFPKQFKLHLDSYYLTGYLIPKKFSAQGISIGLSKRF